MKPINKNIVFLLLPFFLISDYSFAQGVDFKEFKNLQSLFKSASESNKYIFIDVYATWCVPCKQMDRDVFSQASVGKLFTEKLIAAKIQIDSNRADNEFVRSWYSYASDFKKKYKVTSLPTYLIFNPKGELVFRTYGAKPVSSMLEMVRLATDPSNNYESMKLRFISDSMRQEELMKFITLAAKIRDEETEKTAALRYKERFLDKLTTQEKLNKKVLDFMVDHYHLIKSGDAWFNLFYHEGEKIDSLFKQKGLSYKMILSTLKSETGIYKQESQPAGKRVAPNWDKIRSGMEKRFGRALSEKIMLDLKIPYYRENGYKEEFISARLEKFKKYGVDTTKTMSMMDVNAFAFNDVLSNSSNTEQLKQVLGYMELILKKSPEVCEWRDTYARILYRLGKKEEAIRNQRLAIEDLKARYEKINKTVPAAELKEYQDTLEKMLLGALNDFKGKV